MGSGWDCAFYHHPDGTTPVKEFLDALAADNPEAVDTIYRKFEIFRRRGLQESLRSELLKPVRGKIFELKVKTEEPRILGFPWRSPTLGSLFMAAAAEMKKGDKLDEMTIAAAEEARLSWLQRYPEGSND